MNIKKIINIERKKKKEYEKILIFIFKQFIIKDKIQPYNFNINEIQCNNAIQLNVIPQESLSSIRLHFGELSALNINNWKKKSNEIISNDLNNVIKDIKNKFNREFTNHFDEDVVYKQKLGNIQNSIKFQLNNIYKDTFFIL